MNRTIVLSALAVMVSLAAILLSLSVGPPPMPPPEPGTMVPLSRSTVGPIIRVPMPPPRNIPDGSEQAPVLRWSGSLPDTAISLVADPCGWVIHGKERPEYKVPPEVCERLRERAGVTN